MKTLSICILLAALLLPRESAGRTWRVTVDGAGDAPTIQAGVDSAAFGDTVLVFPGTYSWTNQASDGEYGMILFYRDVTGIVLRSRDGPGGTVIDAEGRGRGMFVMANNEIVVDGFTFVNGRAPVGYDAGGGLIGHLSAPVIRNCVFSGNVAGQGGGLWFGGVSSPIIENCVFTGNEAAWGGGVCLVNSSLAGVLDGCLLERNRATIAGGGLFAFNYAFELRGCVIASNVADDRGGGIGLDAVPPSSIERVTVAANAAPLAGGLHLTGGAALDVFATIVARSGAGAAIVMTDDCLLAVRCCDLFGNAGGDGLPGLAVDGGENFSLDPAFCGVPGSGNYDLQSDSPCLPVNRPGGLVCGRVGARPAGCGDVPTSRSTWGAIRIAPGKGRR